MEEIKNEISANDFVNYWLEKQKSKSTKIRYSSSLKDFYKLVFEADTFNEVKWERWNQLTPMDVYSKFIEVIRNRNGKTKDSSIKTHMAAVRSFVKTLSSNKVADLNYDYIMREVLDTSDLINDTDSVECMSQVDYERFLEWLRNERFKGRYEYLGEKYALATEFIFLTASRVEAVFKNVTWDKFRTYEDTYGNTCYKVYVFDKGAKNNDKVLRVGFVERLKRELYNGDNEQAVFDGLNVQSYRNVVKEFGLLVNKSYSPHSLRVGAATAFYNLNGGDLPRVQQFLNHEDPKTTMKYIRLDNDFTKTGGYILSSSVKEEALKELSKDDLLSIIMANKSMALKVAMEAERRGVINSPLEEVV